jgi:hypothetical protein
MNKAEAKEFHAWVYAHEDLIRWLMGIEGQMPYGSLEIVYEHGNIAFYDLKPRDRKKTIEFLGKGSGNG